MHHFLTIFLSLVILSCTSSKNSITTNVQNSKEPIVKTLDGLLRGTSNDTVSVFKGIPFAAPPIGLLRWRPPQAVTPWLGVRDALSYGPSCAQAGWGGSPGTIIKGSSEDCLYLNIWKPSKADAKSRLPVMVWIHGGGFVGGSGSESMTNGDQFARQGVVLVTINYRLGRLGFFAHPALSEEHPDEPKGNYGYMDQIAALQWVKKNISAFGGDPHNVTIFGQSAGGVSVHSLLTIPSAQGLFHKAISQSGGGRDGVLTGRPLSKENANVFYPVSAETIGVNFAKKHGIEGKNADALEKLRAMKVEDIIDGGQENNGEGGPRIYAGIILDGKLVVETAESAYKNNRFAKVPLMVGSTNAEISGSFVNNSKTNDELFSLFGQMKDEATAAYNPQGNKDFAEIIVRFNTDWVWAEPARMTAKAYCKSKTDAYIYQFSYVPLSMKVRMKYGAGHASEIAYVFNNLHSRWGIQEVTEDDKKVANTMNSYWVNFAKTGNPNASNLPYWPLYSTEKNQILEIENSGKPVSKSDPAKARLDVIEKSEHLKYQLQSRGI